MNHYGLVPLRNFAQFDKDLFRCAQPIEPYEYQWLTEVLGIKTIVNLRKELNHDKRFFHHVVTVMVADHEPPTLRQAKHFIKLIQTNTEPLLIHCAHGHGRTSTFCVLARIARGWSLEKAMKEEEVKYHYNFKHHYQKEFLIKHFK